MKTSFRFGAVAVIAAGLAASLPAFAKDVPGSKDHPMVGRYVGAEITQFKSADFDEVRLLKAPLDLKADGEKLTDGNSLRLEGKVLRIRYDAPKDRSSLEVMRNYEESLAAKGFETVFACADAVSWTIAFVVLRPLCEAHAEKRHLVYDGMKPSFFTRGNRVTPCRFRAPPIGALPSGAPSQVVRWRSLEGTSFLLQIAVRPDLMSHILGGLGLAGWLFLSPAGRALRRKR